MPWTIKEAGPLSQESGWYLVTPAGEHYTDYLPKEKAQRVCNALNIAECYFEKGSIVTDRIRTHFPDGDPTNLGVEFLTPDGHWIPIFTIERTVKRMPGYSGPPSEKEVEEAARLLQDYELHAMRMNYDKDLAFVAIERSRNYFADKSEALDEHFDRAMAEKKKLFADGVKLMEQAVTDLDDAAFSDDWDYVKILLEKGRKRARQGLDKLRDDSESSRL